MNACTIELQRRRLDVSDSSDSSHCFGTFSLPATCNTQSSWLQTWNLTLGRRIFCLVNNARFRRFRRFPVGNISRNLNTTTLIYEGGTENFRKRIFRIWYVDWSSIASPSLQMTTVPERGVVTVTWPFLLLENKRTGGPNISGEKVSNNTANFL